MLNNEDIEHNLSLLITHRRTLSIYLERLAITGRANMQPEVAHGIQEARRNIRSIKEYLRSYGISISDDPNDEVMTINVMENGGNKQNIPEIDSNIASKIIDKRTLRETIVRSFNHDELEILCNDIEVLLSNHNIDLQVNLEMIGGSSKALQVLNLIQYLDRRGHLQYLVHAILQHRPGIV
jgi:effector-associated domain 7 (EAD7)-containing protein